MLLLGLFGPEISGLPETTVRTTRTMCADAQHMLLNTRNASRIHGRGGEGKGMGASKKNQRKESAAEVATSS